MSKPLIEAPANDSAHTYETLAYLDAYDAVLNCDYAFVAYKETDSSGWRVRIKSSQTPGATFEPDIISNQARATSSQGRPSMRWGYSFDPTPTDPRNIQFRVHVKDGKATNVEIRVQLRKADGTPDQAKSVKFPWPA